MPMATTAKKEKIVDEIPSIFNSEPGVFQSLPVPKTIPSKHKQVILGNPPAKSNCYIIIILKNKDKTKQHASLAKATELKQYERGFALQCMAYRNAMIDEPFKIEVDVYFKQQRSDLDNSLKVILDCLQTARAITNDNLCDGIIANKFVDKFNPRIEFTIIPQSGSFLKPIPII